MLGTGTVIRAAELRMFRMHAFHDGQVNRASPHGYSASPLGSNSVAGRVLFRGTRPRHHNSLRWTRCDHDCIYAVVYADQCAK